MRTYARAYAIADELGDKTNLFQATFGLFTNHVVRAEHKPARQLADELLGLAERCCGDVVPTIAAHRALAWSCSLVGELDLGRDHIEHVLALYQPAIHRDLAFRFVQDPRITGLAILAWNSWLRGYPAASASLTEQTLREGDDFNHAFTVAYATYVGGAAPRYLSGDFAGSKELLEALAELSEEQVFPYWRALAAELRGVLLVHEGDEDEGVRLIKEGAAIRDRLGFGLFRPLVPTALASFYLDSGKRDQAVPLLDRTLTLVHQTGERWIGPELLRLRGNVVALEAADPRRAENWFERSLDLARSQSAKSWELRAATSLARLWAEQGERHKAHDLLAPIYDWFTEGFDTPDLIQAKELLDGLR